MPLLKRFNILLIICILLLSYGNVLAQTPVASFTVSQQSGCTPFQVVFNNTSVNATTWFWDFGNGNTSNAKNPTNIYLNSGSFTVKLIAYNATGVADSVIHSGFINTVNPPQVAFTSSSNTVCLESSTVNFINQSTNYDAVLWDFGDGTTSTITNPSHQYSAPGMYTVTQIVYNNQYGCSTSLSKNAFIHVLNNPSGAFSANVTSFCISSTPVLFSATTNSATSFLWQFGDGTTSNQASPSHVYSQPGVYNVTLITSNAQGCRDTITKNNYIEVLANPVPSIITSQPLTGCNPYSSFFSTNATGVANYWWDFGDSTTSQLASPGHSFHISNSYTVLLQTTYQNGCSNSNSVNITVVPKPVVNYSLTGTQGCAPLNTTFTNLTAGSGNTYLWNFGDGNTSTQVNPVHTFTTSGTYYTTLTVTNAAGCSSQYNHFIPVNVSSINATFTADDLSGCTPHLVNFSHSGGGLLNYNWNFGDGTTSSQASPSHMYTSNGNYTVTLNVSNNSGCSNTYTLPQPIQVNNAPNNFNPVAPVTACAPFTVNVYDNSISGSSWLWDFGDGATSTLQDPVHTYTTPGTYVVTLNTTPTGTGCSQFINPYGTYIINGGEANFSLTQTLCPPYTATFTDQSTNAVAWFWDFGDGTTSNQQNPVHVYSQPGSYNVSLTITTAQGCTYTMYHNYAATFLPLSANATAITTDTVLPMTVNFSSNSSGATMWFWDFGDGNTSTLQNPVHTYTTPGPYDITLIVSNPQCSQTYDYPAITLGSGSGLPVLGNDSTHVPDPVFSCVPYEMSFSNPVQHTTAWLWDFGDGGTSTLENPVHIFADPGVFYVSLITWDTLGVTDTIEFVSPFYLTGATADFDINFTNSCNGSTVTMVNNSVNAVSYYWDFGDGTISTDPNPTHTYNTSGVNYIISLTVTDTLGCTDFMASSYYAATTNLITVNTRRGCAGDTIQFSSGSAVFASYLWDFGDGTTSGDSNPWHIYADSGSYNVSLTVTDALGCDVTWNLSSPVKIFKPVANFVSQVSAAGCVGIRHDFINLSTGATSYLWNFNNITQSSQPNPQQFFYAQGYHFVTLTAFAEGCADSITVNQAVYVPNLTAAFTSVQVSECYPVVVNYIDNSTDAVSWFWEFGDGTSSTQKNPIHTYYSKPAGPVTLTVTSASNCVKSVSHPNITALNTFVSFNDTTGCAPFTLSVTDSSENIASWLWDFGDGTTSTLSNPQHTYANPGIYEVNLITTSPTGCTSEFFPAATIKVNGPVADFTSNNVVSCAPTVVNFIDNSSGATAWNWDFGNGNHSVLQNPVHIYNQPGNYDITLAVTDSLGCSDTLLINEMVHITGSIAGFTIANNSGCAPFNIQFTDTSISAFNWLWNFGDGNSSVDQNPVHQYDTPGNYTVTLITEDTTGCQSVFTNPVPVTVLQPPVAAFSISNSSGCVPFNVSFVNNSTGSTNYTWDFGDGNVSSQPNPNHTYTLPGVYHISLIASSGPGCTDTILAENPVVVGQNPLPSFTAGPNNGCAPLPVQFNNNTTGNDSTTVYLWDFGDGTTSSAATPVHTYNQSGIYNVTLTATNNFVCTASITENNIVAVSNNTPPAPVLMKSVSVAGPDVIEVTWGNQPALSLSAYNLYRLNSLTNNFDLIYTDNNPSNTSLNATTVFDDTTVATANKTYTYLVQAVNNCNAATPISQHTPHTSINLGVSVNNNIPRLIWSFYGGSQVEEYRLYRQDNLSGSFNQIGTVDATTQVFYDSTVYCGMQAAYRVAAIDLGGEGFVAWSDIEEENVPGNLVNQKVDIVRSTVMNDSYVFTEWAPPVLAPHLVTEFELYRSIDNISFNLYKVLSASETNFSDYNVNVMAQNYYYRIKVNNVCDLETTQGHESSSILLTGAQNDQNQTQLRWTPYSNWDTGVDYYVIERLDENGLWQTIDVVNGNIEDYLDKQ